MIFFFGHGRLGNQLFQYSFIKSVEDKEHTIVTYSFKELLELIDSASDVMNIRNRALKMLITRLAIPLLNFLAKARLIRSYQVDTYNENGFVVPDITYTKKEGLIPVVYVYPCFAQSEAFFQKDVVKKLAIKKHHEELAREFLASIPEKYNKIFVHLRRGDYKHFSVLGNADVTLPDVYYQEAIQWYEKHIENPYFIFLTDDPEYVEIGFKNVLDKAISKNPMYVDFAIITQCEYGIMSNSSFSWWAAYMMKNRKKVFAPKYWLGWKSGVEYHKGITPSFAELVELKR